MAQGTVVLKLSATEQAALERSVDAGQYERRRQAHARFWAKGDGVVAVLYTSGKLVLQGAGIDLFLVRHLPQHAGAGTEPDAPAAAAPSGEPSREPRDAPRTHGERLEGGPLIGGDESGKGDYFGPLVVAVVRIDAGEAEELRARGVMDSKRVTDPQAQRLGAWIMGRFPHAVRVLDPPEYMRRWEETKNIALVLSDLYAEAVEELLDGGQAQPGEAVLIDQFSKNTGRLGKAFARLDLRLHQEHRAERAPAVAAASLVARKVFLDGLVRLSDDAGLDLPKGAGTPALDTAADLKRLWGERALERFEAVAKVHFKTTDRFFPGVRDERGWRSPSEQNRGAWQRRRRS